MRAARNSRGWRRCPRTVWRCDACFAAHALEFFSSVDEIALRNAIDRRVERTPVDRGVNDKDDPRVAAFGAFAPGTRA